MSRWTNFRNSVEDVAGAATVLGPALQIGGGSGGNIAHNVLTGQNPLRHAQGAAAVDIAGLGAGMGLSAGMAGGAAVNPETIGAPGFPAAAGTSNVMAAIKGTAAVLSAAGSLGGIYLGAKAARAINTGAPEVPPPVTMPTQDSPIVRGAQQTSIAEQVMRRGRASTILTQPNDRLGA